MDVSVYYALNRFAGNWFFDHLAGESEMNGLLRGGVFFSLYWYFWFRNASDRERTRRAIVVILGSSLLALAVNRTIAFLLPFRVRPMHNTGLLHHALSIPLTPNLEHWSAFPSDTATYYFALAFGLAWLSRRLTIPAMAYTAVWVCLPRIYLGLHYLSDIVVGAALGILVVWTALRTDSLASGPAARAVALERTPGPFYAVAFLLTFEMASVFDHIRDAVRGVLHAALVGPHRHFIFTQLLPACAAAFVLGLVYTVFRLRHARRREAVPAAAPLSTHKPRLT